MNPRKLWVIRSKRTPWGKRFDVATPTPIRPGLTLYLVTGLVGDDGHKTRAAAVKHAREKYGPQLGQYQP